MADKVYIQDIKRALESVVDTADGKLIFEFLEQMCGMYYPTLSNDPYEAIRADGMRSVVLTLHTILREKSGDLETLFKQLEAL